MEGFDIDNIEEIITDWYFSNNEKMDMLGCEFLEITKDEEEGTFDFSFRRNNNIWHLKYGFSSYYFEVDGDKDQELLEKCNEEVTKLDESVSISQEEPNSGVIQVLEKCLVDILVDEKKAATPKQETDMDVDWDAQDYDIPDERPVAEDEEVDELEGEDYAGWSDEEEEVPEPSMEKKRSSLNDQINKYNLGLASKDGMQIFRKLKVVQDAKNVQGLLEMYMKELPETFTVQIFEALLMFKLTIDLNFMSIDPHVYESLGFEMREPVEYLFIFDDNKLLMFLDDKSIYEKSMEELCGLGILKIEFLQQTNELTQTRYQSYLQLLHETFFKKSTDGTSISEEMKAMEDDDLLASKSTLLEMGFTPSESESALKKNKFSVQNAINYLLGRKNKKKALKDEEEEEKEDILDIDPKHMFFSNITGKQLKDNCVLNYFRYIIYSLDSIQEYCCICRDKLGRTSSKIKCCDKELCEFSFEEALGISITPEMRTETKTFTLDLSILSECVMSARAGKTFEPFPSFFLKDKELRTKRGYLDNIKLAREKGGEAKDVKESNKDIKKIRQLFKFIPSVEKCMAKCSDDQVLLSTINKQTKDLGNANLIYKLMQYLTCTNRVNFKLLEGDEKLSGDTSIDEYMLYNHEASQEAKFQELKQKHGSVFTFHGSSIENWYSILRNGPRNLSQTKMMTAGAAMGAGVYSARQFATASGYCGYRGGYHNPSSSTLGQATSWKHSITKGKCIIGILEIIKKPEYSKQTDFAVVVCPDDHCIMLRYIWVWTSGTNFYNNNKAGGDSFKLGFDTHYYEQLEAIKEKKQVERKSRLQEAHERAQQRMEEQKVMKEKLEQQMQERDKQEEEKKYEDKIEKLETKFVGKGSHTATKRILKEYKHFQTSADIENFEIDFGKGDNIYNWTVKLDILKFELTPELREDFEQAKIELKKEPTLVFEIIFSSSFPFDPPFIRVVQPIFKFHTGHVTIGGSLCMESLTPAGWSSARSIEGLFIEILSIILQGGARVERSRLGQCYSLVEARAAFERVAKHHGWL